MDDLPQGSPERPGTRTVLHVGCGAPAPGKLHPLFRQGEWREVRVDVDPEARPDILASMVSMPSVGDGSVDAVWSSHSLEHLYPHEVPVAMAEFRRVLRPGGLFLATLPDLQGVAELVAADRLEDPAYLSSAGPVAPIDMLYGFRPALSAGQLGMAHRTGFTARTLAGALSGAGFTAVKVVRDGRLALWAEARAPRGAGA